MNCKIRIIAVGSAFAFFALGTFGQPTTPPPAFEVASVKPTSRQQSMIAMQVYPGGRLTVTNYTLRMLIQEAYSVEHFQISGGPRWASEERFSIIAKPPDSSRSAKIVPMNPNLPPPEEERLMLRTLLEDRFQLKVHSETTEGPIFMLVVASKGAKLQKTKDPNQFPVVVTKWAPDYLQGYNATTTLLAARLAELFRRPVLDHTGLEGAFDFKLEYAWRDSDEGDGPSLVTAIAQLGLKLVPAKGPVPHVVIDKALRPTEN